jgi:hypothetical protein
VQCLYDYVLYTGDELLARQLWPNLVRLMNVWYRTKAGPGGLVVNDLGHLDYGYTPRSGGTIAYFNAGYALALEQAAEVASWIDEPAQAQSWRRRASTLKAHFNAAFWDSSAGAYTDSTTGAVVHPQDGNVFAILAGLASTQQAASALNFLDTINHRGYGNAIADNNVWDDPKTWGILASKRVSPFISYFELLARFKTNTDDSALNLIRREWGYMLANGPKTTMWETIGPYGGSQGTQPSFDHGWSSGAAPALTSYVLGVRPTSPGFATFTIEPHTGISSSLVYWATGTVPTPHGNITVHWQFDNTGKLALNVHAPAGTVWTNRPKPA